MNNQLLISLVAATATITTFSSSALAGSLVPQKEGEINVGLGCIDLDPNKCIEVSEIPFIKSIESLTDSTTGNRSRLFVDNLATANTYGSGTNAIKFKTKDAGTNPTDFWFRPSEHNESTGYAEEKGQLEVGTFSFTFTEILKELSVDFFDTESNSTTGIIAINGVNLASPDWVAKGADGNIVSQTFTNISSITLKLGQDYNGGTGDGVDFNLNKQDVPEPTTLLSLLAVGLFGATSLGKASKKAAK
ncbi:MAG: LEVG family PEP-CTERM protein [Spirulinaceae cyanobacterium]